MQLKDIRRGMFACIVLIIYLVAQSANPTAAKPLQLQQLIQHQGTGGFAISARDAKELKTLRRPAIIKLCIQCGCFAAVFHLNLALSVFADYQAGTLLRCFFDKSVPVVAFAFNGDKGAAGLDRAAIVHRLGQIFQLTFQAVFQPKLMLF